MNNYTIDQRNNAKNKINKLLALANDRAATDSEKDTALQMANKLAEKYGFTIKKNENNPVDVNNTNNQWNKYTVKMYDKKFVSWILHGLGYKSIVRDKYFEVCGDFDINTFSKLYKEVYKGYCDALNRAKMEAFSWNKSESIRFKKVFCIGLSHGASGEYISLYKEYFVYEIGYEFGAKFQNLRKEG